MTGWRVGYVVAPLEVADALAKAQEPVVANCSSVSQKAAEAALLGPQDVVREMREAYRRRRGDATAPLRRGARRGGGGAPPPRPPPAGSFSSSTSRSCRGSPSARTARAPSG